EVKSRQGTPNSRTTPPRLLQSEERKLCATASRCSRSKRFENSDGADHAALEDRFADVIQASQVADGIFFFVAVAILYSGVGLWLRAYMGGRPGVSREKEFLRLPPPPHNDVPTAKLQPCNPSTLQPCSPVILQPVIQGIWDAMQGCNPAILIPYTLPW